MNRTVRQAVGQYLAGWSRRDLFRRASILAASPALFRRSAAAAPAPASAGKLQLASDNIYASIGVRPLINCRGTLTVISGSLELPEVRAAAEAAAQHHVALDELMEGIAKRIAEITGAEWALVSAGCAAGIAHTTAACVTGGNPDLHVRIPDLSGFPKDEVVIPKVSRNQYDQAVRSVGVRIIEVGDAAEYEAALGPKVAMVYIMANPRLESGPLTYDAVYSIAKKKNIPVFIDAAAEMLTIPNGHLQKGATFVGYSGGKCLRGPQCAGLIFGPQRSAQSGLGEQRPPPWPWPGNENRQGGNGRHAGRGRNVGPARPARKRTRHGRRGCRPSRRAPARSMGSPPLSASPGVSITTAPRSPSTGTRPNWESPARRCPIFCGPPNRASLLAAPAAGAGTPARPEFPLPHT